MPFDSTVLRVRTGRAETVYDLTADCEAFLREVSGGADLLPADQRWRHSHGSPGHGRDHVLPAFIAPHATLPVIGGRLELGTWQSVVLVDTNRDNPDRQVRLSFLG